MYSTSILFQSNDADVLVVWSCRVHIHDIGKARSTMTRQADTSLFHSIPFRKTQVIPPMFGSRDPQDMVETLDRKHLLGKLRTRNKNSNKLSATRHAV